MLRIFPTFILLQRLKDIGLDKPFHSLILIDRRFEGPETNSSSPVVQSSSSQTQGKKSTTSKVQDEKATISKVQGKKSTTSEVQDEKATTSKSQIKIEIDTGYDDDELMEPPQVNEIDIGPVFCVKSENPPIIPEPEPEPSPLKSKARTARNSQLSVEIPGPSTPKRTRYNSDAQSQSPSKARKNYIQAMFLSFPTKVSFFSIKSKYFIHFFLRCTQITLKIELF